MKQPILLVLFCFFTSILHGAVPLPDHIVYGTVSVDGNPITRLNTNVVVEARRLNNGQLLASYPMGSSIRLGQFLYELRIKVDDDSSNTIEAAHPGETLRIAVSDSTHVLDSTNHQIIGHGTLSRLDFGGSGDANENGVPDNWELAHFGSASTFLEADQDGDGTTDRNEYISGTDPKDPNDLFRLLVTNASHQVEVSFLARLASGPGYEAHQRFYALEASSDLNAGNWQEIDNLSRIPGANQWVIYRPPPSNNAARFFRARIWLENP